ncbi:MULTISPECIES: hypothetical protein [Corynebacterium]|uniref:Uncharacterized protein n=1 Tax=Corynebacterium singulare TaxID=161899 RepID=A0A0B6F4E8_9CORY|nr:MULTISPECIES: hypothetical protein [Corynebacterium]AJI79325.1 hypothetical protein CSING_09030 [Corynebacterium singulare]MCG7274995.1 hypothetical protein [Corynebacterium singulare]MCQ9675635.1 hypothetical protein [Corynebacterium sp. BF-R-2]
MLIGALVLAFVAFVAFVNYILTAADWSLYLLFASAGVGIVLFVADTVLKLRRKHDE